MTDYDFPFERVKNIKEHLTGEKQDEAKKPEPKVEELTAEQIKKEESKSEVEKHLRSGHHIDLSSVEEGNTGEANEATDVRMWL